MDGLKGRLTDSLRFRLSAGLAVAILCVALIAGMFAFIAAFKAARELQDDMLRQMAALFDEHHLPVPHLANEGRLADSDEEAGVVVEVLSSGTASGQDSRLPATLADGLQTAMVKGESFRILVKPLGPDLRLAVVKNLVDNAIRYTPSGGGIDLWVRQAPDGITLTVEDSGPGIPEAERLRVLDPFYRVLGNEETGSGLGLSIVKTLVERMGGRIALTDAERSPTGLAVHIHLPVIR